MLSAIVVSHNRRDALAATLRELAVLGLFETGEVIVADNNSSDGTPAMVRQCFPMVRLLELTSNLGVEAYNLAAAAAKGDTLLVLDDDSWPDGPSLCAAVDTLAARPSLAAVALLPVHPSLPPRRVAPRGRTRRVPPHGLRQPRSHRRVARLWGLRAHVLSLP